jgi:hypothetical protein
MDTVLVELAKENTGIKFLRVGFTELETSFFRPTHLSFSTYAHLSRLTDLTP